MTLTEELTEMLRLLTEKGVRQETGLRWNQRLNMARALLAKVSASKEAGKVEAVADVVQFQRFGSTTLDRIFVPHGEAEQYVRKEFIRSITPLYLRPSQQALSDEEKLDHFYRGVIAALGPLATWHKHGTTEHDEIVNSVGKEALYRHAEPEDVEWAGLDPEFYAAILAAAGGSEK